MGLGWNETDGEESQRCATAFDRDFGELGVEGKVIKLM